ncbi:MAG TPA: acetylornithine deacetylase [Haliea salexigens]|uniref:Acetylornithine deacetylase n=1 Tax=Haliea salexigens TaxID=287487 RepID=A0A3C1KKW0_9GAMM|nr:acetylornithine deacetylase [Haliea sp.]HAN27241.1 acetylornithine deacetylase [Haliea salexigens]|tara:strand:- start:20400 stop:21551 length:1152 start_codon:yes stop_codon:yes gene_type:complete
MSHHDKHIISQLRALVGTPSVSSTDSSWDQGNRAVIELLAGWLSALGFRTEIMDVSPDGQKANLIATLGSGPGGLVLAGHTDTVPFDEGRWRSDPLQLTERDQRLYGLGSTDMKGFFPIAIAAARAFVDKPLQQPLIILATADEESSMDGARALAAAGRPRARAAIIGEPTSLNPVRLHKGIMMEAIEVTGLAGHSSNPALGVNALDVMHELMSEMMQFRHQLATEHANSAFEVAFPTLNLGCIHGGDSPNRICGRCELHFDLRLTPSAAAAGVREQLQQRLQTLAHARGARIALRSLVEPVPPFEQPANSELVRLAEKLTGHSALAVGFATEAPFLQAMGMETIVMGPGSIDRAHQPDEYLELSQIQPCVDLLQSCIAHYCL